MWWERREREREREGGGVVGEGEGEGVEGGREIEGCNLESVLRTESKTSYTMLLVTMSHPQSRLWSSSFARSIPFTLLTTIVTTILRHLQLLGIVLHHHYIIIITVCTHSKDSS